MKTHLAAIVESSDDAIIGKDLQGTIMSWNNGAARMFGYTAAEAVGQSIAMLIPTRFVDEEPRILERIRRGETLEHYETVRRHKDGREINISLTVSPLRDDAGNVVGASKIARDITERKRVEQRLLTQHTVTRILAEAASLQEAAPRILRAICASLIWNVAALWTVDKEAGVLRCVEVWKESVEVPEFEADSRATTFDPASVCPEECGSAVSPPTFLMSCMMRIFRAHLSRRAKSCMPPSGFQFCSAATSWASSSSSAKRSDSLAKTCST